MISLADGSDLGGSLRNPAGFCNVVGLRPSPGRVPAWPVTDVADVLEVEGPMGRLPVGLQLVGRRRDDWPLLQVAHAFEAATGHGQVIPPLLR